MNVSLFVSEIMFTIIISIAVLVWWQLKISRNGMLRKIFLWYFAVEIWVFGWSAVYWLDTSTMPLEWFRLLVLTPKVIIKLVLLWWLVKQNRKRKK